MKKNELFRFLKSLGLEFDVVNTGVIVPAMRLKFKSSNNNKISENNFNKLTEKIMKESECIGKYRMLYDRSYLSGISNYYTYRLTQVYKLDDCRVKISYLSDGYKDMTILNDQKWSDCVLASCNTESDSYDADNKYYHNFKDYKEII